MIKLARSRAYEIAFRLGAKLNRNYESTFARAEELANRTANKIKRTVVAVGGLAVSATAVAGAVDTFKNFEQAMANVAAASEINQMSEDYALLEKAALDAGKVSSKTATEAAQALGKLSLAGWDVQDSISGLMPILKLSEATAMDLDFAADIVTDTMASLGLKVNDMPAYLDKLAKAQSKSNMTATQLMESYVAVGGTMNSFNVPVEESAAILGLMANRGTKGAEAGNSLNSVLVNLTTRTGQAGEALKKLDFSAFDEESGKFIGLENSLYLLKEKLSGASDEQMAYFTAAIGGKIQLGMCNNRINQ